MNIFKLRHEIKNIPESEGGIYWFKLRFPTAYSFGLSEKIIDSNLGSLVDTITIFSNIIYKINIDSRINHKNRLMLINSYRLELNSEILPRQKKKLTALLSKKSLREIKAIINLTKYAVDGLPPVYVGIADRQSFKDRFDQHFCGETSLFEGMLNLGISWDWLNFVTFPQHAYDIKDNREIEQIFHLVLKAIFSKG